MDVEYVLDNKIEVPGELNNNVSEDPSMEEIICSVRSSLLGTGRPPLPTNPPGDVKNPPLCSSPINMEPMASPLSVNTDPNQSFEDVFDDTLTLDDIGIPSGKSKGRDREGTGCQGSQHPSDGQFTSSDLPLSNGFRDDEDEELEVSTREHPRLQSTFYQRLREKYPKAFRRRSSISSDTASVCSDAGPTKPSNMTPMPKGHLNPGSTSAEGGQQPYQMPYGVGLPPRHPSVGAVKKSPIKDNNNVDSVGSLTTHIDDMTRHLCQDLTITGTSRRSKSPGRHRYEPRMTMKDKKMAGILKKDLEMLNTSLTSESSSLSYNQDSSHLSLKERLHKNQMTLRSLLSEENNPLKKGKPWRNRRGATLNKSFESDITLDNELSISIDTTDGPNAKRNHCDEFLLIPQLPSQAGISSVAIDTPEQKRSLVDLPQRKHLGTKRYVSPDSSHDSAVDMDTASLQSSPGSSDTQTTVNTCRPSRVKSGIRPSQSGRGSQNSGFINTDSEHSPRERLTSGRSHPDFQLAHGSNHTKGDSDVDSGIAHGAYPSSGSRERKDSSSSMENDQELESIMSFSRVQGGPRYTAISSQDLRGSHRQKNSSSVTKGKSGPLKADHSIQPSSPRRSKGSDEAGRGASIGGQYKASSSTDLSQKRASPVSKVRFEDEMSGDHHQEHDLGHQQRAVSNPDLRISGESPRPEDIPAGCSRRAPKLRGARRSSPAPPVVRNERAEGQPSLSHGTQGLPPSGRSQDVRTKMHKLRSQNRTPTELIYAAANDESFSEVKDMSLHRASPVIITSNGRVVEDDYSYVNDNASQDGDLNNEVAELNGFNDAWTYALSAKSHKKPWKKNKGKYNPSESVENIHRGIQRSQVRTVISRPVSGQGDPYTIDKLPMGRAKGQIPRPASCTAEIHTPSERTNNRIESVYDEVKDQSFLSAASDGQNADNPYEEVRFGQKDKKEDMYAVPERRSRSRTKSRQDPGVVTDHDESIGQEEAPPIPERGYMSDLERYKDLSGSRTSLAGKMDSFRKAAKNKWSALRRAVSLERVDHSATEDSTDNKLKKSPSLQSLAKRFSFKKKDKAKPSGSHADLPPKPSQTRQSRPSSAPLGRYKKHSTSLTSLNTVDSPQNFRPIGKLKQVNPDGSQIIELVRPPKGPFGFYIARGNVKYGGGVFVSRLSDGLPDHFFASLLGVGDEILEINCQLIDNLTLDEVYKMMSERHHLLLKTLPYVARNDT